MNLESFASHFVRGGVSGTPTRFSDERTLPPVLRYGTVLHRSCSGKDPRLRYLAANLSASKSKLSLPLSLIAVINRPQRISGDRIDTVPSSG